MICVLPKLCALAQLDRGGAHGCLPGSGSGCAQARHVGAVKRSATPAEHRESIHGHRLRIEADANSDICVSRLASEMR